MYNHPKWLPTRRDLNTFFYAVLEWFGDKGWGNNEALNLLFWGPALPLTVGWALARMWAPYWHQWEMALPSVYLLHLVSGVLLWIIAARNAASLSIKELKRRASWVMTQLYMGWFVAAFLTLFTACTFLFMQSSAPRLITPINKALVIYCVVINLYVGSIFLLYRKYPAYRIEGYLGLSELFLWTGFIVVTGGCQSPFFFTYFLPLISVFRRGFTETNPTDPRYRGQVNEGAGLLAKLRWFSDWHNYTWVNFVLYPFCWLMLAQLSGAILCVALNASGICNTDGLYGSWLLMLVTNMGRFYLNGAPYLFVLMMMAITLEIETDSARVLGQLMKKKALEDWTKTLEQVVTELAAIIKENYMFNCSGILAVTFTEIGGTAEYSAHELYLGDIRTQKVEGITDITNYQAREDGKAILSALLKQCGKKDDVGESIFRDFFYYIEEPRERRRFQETLEPLAELSPYVAEFWRGTKSLCYVIFPHPDRRSRSKKSYTVIFLKSELPGEFDANAAKLYEAIFTQVSGVLGKYEEYEEIQKEAIKSGMIRETSERIADLAMTLTHDFKKQADRLYINLGKTRWMDTAPCEAGKEWNTQLAAYLLYRRLALVDEVARYTSPASEKKGLFESIRDTPDERSLDVLQAIAQACWLTPALASASEGEEMSLNGGSEFIRSLSWNLIQRSSNESRDDWKDILKCFFSEIGADFFSLTHNVSFSCAKSPEGETNITTDLWVLVFHEIARNSVKGKVLSRRLDAQRVGDDLVLEWISYFSGGETQAKMSWGTDKVNPFPKEGELSEPGKPSVPGPGWGQYGNFVVVEKLLQSEYRVHWNLCPDQDQFSWTTRIKINSEILKWS